MPAPKQCGRYTLYGEGAAKVLIPIKSVTVKSEIRGTFAKVDVELMYINTSQNSPYECTYTFPKEKSTILSKFTAIIGDREV